MKIYKDYDVIYYINKHYEGIIKELRFVKNYEGFCENEVYQKAIILDLLQIGENVNKLSEILISKISKKDIKGVIDFRNQLVHGYKNNNNLIIWNVIQKDIPNLVDNINKVAKEIYNNVLNELLFNEVVVYVDRPKGSIHPNYKDTIYPINYGYIKEIIAPDDEFQDVYIIGVDEPIKEFNGQVIAIINRKNDIESKLVVAPKGKCYSSKEIINAVNFQEQYFQIELIINKRKLG